MIKYLACIWCCLGIFESLFSQKNSIVIVSAIGKPIYVIINGDSINKKEQGIVKAFDLESGNQHIKITTKIKNTELIFSDSILLSDKSKFINKEFTYGLILEHEKLALVFKSVSEQSGPKVPFIPAEPKEIIPLEDNSKYGNLYQAKNNKPVFYLNYNSITKSCLTNLTDKEVVYALNLITKANDDERKVNYVTQIIQNNCYSVSQIKQLINTLSIDMDKLNGCKNAYEHLTDKQNASSFSEILIYQSMKESYADFLKDQTTLVQQTQLNCTIPVDEKQFDAFLNQIKNGGYENEKLKVCKKLFASHCFSSEQIKKIAVFFSHDRETLELFKTAYPVITDKNNAKTLTSEFQFTETKTEFLKFISN